MNEVYNGGFTPEFSVSMRKETTSLVWDYVYETRKQKAKLAEKYIWKRNMKSFSTETLNFPSESSWPPMFWSCQNYMNSAKRIAETLKLIVEAFQEFSDGKI